MYLFAHANRQVRQMPVWGQTLVARGFAGDALRCKFRAAVQAGPEVSRLPAAPRKDHAAHGAGYAELP
ncbi:hypothetical protein LPB72_01050 [Hydrogenophaga crassostreae]|uniref:Uncharacterized protein n=1 Tax=Hydrogenophaga crassostreae TaxID=1763535 RepID=A0A162PE10_9BURK|nr:hypothetical protein LPB072_14765 [Hydrogenophaga crassostreae]OAD44127.1 hypothetical protein LPB72_01050 [Hydrogenophaga crassostreae]